MDATAKTCLSGICGFLISAAFLAGGAGAVAVSTDDIKTDFDAAEVLSRDMGTGGNKRVQDAVFDGNNLGGMGRLGRVAPVQLNFTLGPSAGTAATQAKPAAKGTKAPPTPADAGLSDKPGVKQKSLDGLTVSPDGNLYKVTKESPWWKFWDSNRSIQKAVPDAEGEMWNGQGEYVGGWQTVLKTKYASNLQVVRGADGSDHFYTQENSWSPKVYRDGKYLTTFSNSVSGDAGLREWKAGADDKVYARYSKNAEDIIVGLDPATKKQQVAARVPAEIRIWTSLESRRVYDGTDSDGNSVYHTEYYTEQHVDRHGVNKFSVARDGRVFTLYKGNVFEEGNNGDRRLLAGSEGHWYTWNNPLRNVPYGDVSSFRVDSYGNLYTVKGGNVAVNNDPLSNTGLGWQEALRVDDAGNLYKTESRWLDTYLTRTNILPDPANDTRIAAAGNTERAG